MGVCVCVCVCVCVMCVSMDTGQWEWWVCVREWLPSLYIVPPPLTPPTPPHPTPHTPLLNSLCRGCVEIPKPLWSNPPTGAVLWMTPLYSRKPALHNTGHLTWRLGEPADFPRWTLASGAAAAAACRSPRKADGAALARGRPNAAVLEVHYAHTTPFFLFLPLVSRFYGSSGMAKMDCPVGVVSSCWTWIQYAAVIAQFLLLLSMGDVLYHWFKMEIQNLSFRLKVT